MSGKSRYYSVAKIWLNWSVLFQAVCIIKKTLQLFKSINATALDPNNDGPDIGQWSVTSMGKYGPTACLIQGSEPLLFVRLKAFKLALMLFQAQRRSARRLIVQPER